MVTMTVYKLILRDEGKVIYEIETNEPFEHLVELERKTFGSMDKEFRASPIRSFLKRMFNHGGKIEIEITR